MRLVLIRHQDIAAFAVLQKLALRDPVIPGCDLPLFVQTQMRKGRDDLPVADLQFTEGRHTVAQTLPALGWNCLCPRKILAVGSPLHIFASFRAVKLGKAAHALTVRVPDDRTADAVRQLLKAFICLLHGQLGKTRIFTLGVLVDLPNGRAGQNIMELVAHQDLPALLQCRRRILCTAEQACRRSPCFKIQKRKFTSAVAALVARHAGVGRAMIFQIQFA